MCSCAASVSAIHGGFRFGGRVVGVGGCMGGWVDGNGWERAPPTRVHRASNRDKLLACAGIEFCISGSNSFPRAFVPFANQNTIAPFSSFIVSLWVLWEHFACRDCTPQSGKYTYIYYEEVGTGGVWLEISVGRQANVDTSMISVIGVHQSLVRCSVTVTASGFSRLKINKKKKQQTNKNKAVTESQTC